MNNNDRMDIAETIFRLTIYLHFKILTTVSEQLTIEIPDTFEPGRNAPGEILLTVPGISHPCLLSELLDTTAGDAPYLRWFDDSYMSHTVALETADSSEG